ncbi:MAG: pyridoxamine 5'-phosphate oxidase family protein [Chloroflexota bacterium]
MKDTLIQKLNDYLASRCHLTLATVTPEGKPLARTVTYCNDGAILYFRADKDSRKVRDILKNPAVAYTIND